MYWGFLRFSDCCYVVLLPDSETEKGADLEIRRFYSSMIDWGLIGGSEPFDILTSEIAYREYGPDFVYLYIGNGIELRNGRPRAIARIDEELSDCLEKWEHIWGRKWPFDSSLIERWLRLMKPSKIMDAMQEGSRRFQGMVNTIERHETAAKATLSIIREAHAEECPMRRDR